MNTNRYVAEIVATFILVFAGCGSIIVNDMYSNALGLVGICLIFGLVIMAMIYSVGNVSGAHMNPAVTISFAVARRFDKKYIIPYIICQATGAILAAIVLHLLFPEHKTLGVTVPSISVERAFAVETILSFILMFVVFNVSTGHMEKGIMAGVAVGGTVALEAMIGGMLTGCSINPVRSLGPALISGHTEHLWLYLTAPVLGTVLAHPLCKLVQGKECCIDNKA